MTTCIRAIGLISLQKSYHCYLDQFTLSDTPLTQVEVSVDLFVVTKRASMRSPDRLPQSAIFFSFQNAF